MFASVYDPESPLARAMLELLNATFVICAVILVLVTVLVVICVVRYRGKPGQIEPNRVWGNKRLEIAWTVVPVLTLIYLFFLTFKAVRASDPPAKGDPDIIVVGHQFWWEVHYPDTAW